MTHTLVRFHTDVCIDFTCDGSCLYEADDEERDWDNEDDERIFDEEDEW